MAEVEKKDGVEISRFRLFILHIQGIRDGRKPEDEIPGGSEAGPGAVFE